MSIASFFFYACLGFAFLLFIRFAMRNTGGPFIQSLLRRLLDTAASVAIVALLLLLATAVLHWFFDGGVPSETVTKLAGYQANLSEWLLTVLSPCSLALIAGALLVLSSLASSDGSAGRSVTEMTRLFLLSQSWLNRAAVLAAVLSAFTFLTTNGNGSHAWLELQLAEAKSAAETLDREIDDFALAASANELYLQVAESLPQNNWGLIAITAKRLSELESAIAARNVRAENSTTGRARSLINNELALGRTNQPQDASRGSPKRPDVINETYRRLSPQTMSDLATSIKTAKSELPITGKATELRQEIRAAFMELTGKAAITKTLPPSVGSGIVGLLTDAVTESALEWVRGRATDIAEEIRASIREGGKQPLSALDAVLNTIKNAVAKSVLVFNPSREERLRYLRQVQSQVGDLKIAIMEEQRGRCPAGEVLLVCPRNGISFCGPRSMVGQLC